MKTSATAGVAHDMHFDHSTALQCLSESPAFGTNFSSFAGPDALTRRLRSTFISAHEQEGHIECFATTLRMAVGLHVAFVS